jgi:hypothetical protein
MPAGWS